MRQNSNHWLRLLGAAALIKINPGVAVSQLLTAAHDPREELRALADWLGLSETVLPSKPLRRPAD